MAYTGKKPIDHTDVTQSQSMTVTDDLTVDTNTLKVDSTNNNVGIGTASPTGATTTTLHINGTTNAGIHITDSASGATDSDGVYLSMDSPNLYFQNKEAGFTAFETSGTERMRIDSSGNVLVGTTSNDPRNFTGGTYGSLLNAGQPEFAVNAGMFINQATGSDGTLIAFRKEGSTVGGITTLSGDIIIGTGDAGISFNDGNNAVIPANFGTNAFSDNFLDLGASSNRWDDVRATNGTIQTSDANEKQQISSLTSAEITAAKAISKLFKTFKWNDKVEAKGDAARTHTGVIAQDVQSAMTDVGLDATKYAFWCSDTWWETQTEVPAVEADEENGIEAKDAYTRTDSFKTAEEAPEGATERTRLGIRYPELLAFIGAATEQRLADIETRLTALEAE